MTDAAIEKALAGMNTREREAVAVKIGVSPRTIHRWAESFPTRQTNPLVRDALEKALQSGRTK